MRKLTVTRKRSLIECASKITLLVECAKDEATTTANLKFFKDFKFQNGKSVELQIPNDSVTIMVVSSTMTAQYDIPAGEQDVTLMAKPKYSPMEGNPFIISEIK